MLTDTQTRESFNANVYGKPAEIIRLSHGWYYFRHGASGGRFLCHEANTAEQARQYCDA